MTRVLIILSALALLSLDSFADKAAERANNCDAKFAKFIQLRSFSAKGEPYKTKITSLSVGKVHDVPYSLLDKGDAPITFKSSIFRTPAPRITVEPRGVVGDKFEESWLHGGKEKAVHILKQDYMNQISRDLGKGDYVPGSLGENALVPKFPDDIAEGDLYSFGKNVVLQVNGTRTLCARVNEALGSKFGVKKLCKREGLYFKVIKAGEIQMGDTVTLVKKSDKHPIYYNKFR